MTDATILSRNEFLALDPTLSLLHANGLIEPLVYGGWSFRANPCDTLDGHVYKTAAIAAYARYLAMTLVRAFDGHFNQEGA